MQLFSSQQPALASTNALLINRVLRNTYLLLGATLIFSGLTAFWSMTHAVKPLNPFITLVCYFALIFITSALRKSPLGIIAVFAFTGFMGYTLGPILDFYIRSFHNGGQLVMTSLGATGIIFVGLSGYALLTRKDFSYMGGFLTVAILGAFLLGLGAMFFHMPMLSLVVSGAFILICSGLILFQTSQIIHGGETSYIMATISLYVSLLNIFLNLLSILGAFSNNRN